MRERRREDARNSGLVDAVLCTSAIKMGSMEAAEAENLRIADDMACPAGMVPYTRQSYEIITI